MDFLIKNGVERIIEETRDHLYKIRPLQEFNFYENGVDRGSGVREKSKQLIELLSSNETIREEREKARALRSKFVGISNDGRSAHMGSYDPRGYDYGRYDSGSQGRYGQDAYGNRSGFGTDSRSGFDGGRSYYGDDRRAGFDERSERYGDDRPSMHREPSQSNSSPFNDRQASFAEKNRGSAWRDAEPEEPPRGTYARPPEPRATTSPRATRPTSNSSTGGKLKVQIKKAGAPNPPQPQGAQEDLFSTSSAPDLFNDDSFAAQPSSKADLEFAAFPPAKSQPAADLFSPSVPAQAAQTTSFDPFAGGDPFSYPRPQQQDLFAAPQPQTQSQPPMQPAAQPNPQFQQQFGGFEAQSFKSASTDFVGLSSAPAHQFAPQTQSSPNNAPPLQQQAWTAPSYSLPTSTHQPENPAMQNVTSHSDTPAANTMKPKSAWGGLVDLDHISKNDSGKPSGPPQGSSVQSSFSGLDGFTKGPQAGVSQPIGMAQQYSPRPMMGPGQQYSMGQPPMAPPRPMGQPSMMGQYGMGQSPYMGNQGMGPPQMMMGNPTAAGQQPMMGQYPTGQQTLPSHSPMMGQHGQAPMMGQHGQAPMMGQYGQAPMMGQHGQAPMMGQYGHPPMMGQQQGMGIPPRGYPSF